MSFDVPKRLAARPADLHSVFLRIEELILASSGADVFEETLKLLASKLYHETRNAALLESGEDPLFSNLSQGIREQCVALLAPYSLSDAGEALDALFENLMTRTSKGNKGQYFTPRYVVDFCVRLAELRGGEAVLDPACGSAAFLSAALDHGAGSVIGYDIDSRAVRIAKLLMLARGANPDSICCGDGLREAAEQSADVVLTNPPFAGEINEPQRLAQFDLGAGRTRVERDVLFLERCMRALRPGGKLAIVLPHNKFAGKQWRFVREWLLANAEILAIVGLGRNTFLPHTHQKANVLLARRRPSGVTLSLSKGEPPKCQFEPVENQPTIFFAQSALDAKDTRGRPTGQSDLGAILERYASNGAPGRTVLDANLTLSPERNQTDGAARGHALVGELAPIAATYCKPGDPGPFVVLDTTHAIDGFIAARPLQVVDSLQSTKKLLRSGDVIVSRLRPYLRQIAYVDAALFAQFANAKLCCSTEFYVLRATHGEGAFLTPFLLTPVVQALLVRSQEGGHHPRVPATVLQNITIPETLLNDRTKLSADFKNVIEAFRRAEHARDGLIRRSAIPQQ